VPLEVVTVAVSPDGVMVPLKDGARAQKRDAAKAQGKHTCGPLGHSEVGCRTMSFYDAEGNRLSTGGRRCACRIPKSDKASLKTMLTQEAETVLSQWPSLVKLADGAPNNSTYLSAAFPPEVELVDFYHACEYLMKAFDTDYGQARGEKIIRALAHRQPAAQNEVGHRLGLYPPPSRPHSLCQARAKNLPIGSGVVRPPVRRWRLSECNAHQRSEHAWKL
jgi:hypothetical protein